MLELKHISKKYVTGSFTQVALDDVSVAFRDNEFVAILGPSGSGKTTMLNVIGGLDHFDSGDLVIDGVSTKKYKDHDWDTYRNNRIGFVFQSYNLIPHQTILQNVELALTLSGVSSAERKQRAREALEKVGLGQHVDKLPNQLSGGQMQRVAIARALINDPEILLADEPTGALDSTTSVQVMDLLKEVAEDRLVIMVTHNPDLANQYATRIVNLHDGKVVDDSDPFDPSLVAMRVAKPTRKTSMSFLTALGLSFNNLMSKKGRTIMTAFAGSIGIIGIAAILALASGVNDYIANVEEETLTAYPLSITSSALDMSSLLTGMRASSSDDGTQQASDENSSDNSDEVRTFSTISNMVGNVGTNDLASLKEYLDANGGGINEYVNAIEYTYDVVPQIFLDTSEDEDAVQVNPESTFSSLSSMSSAMSAYTSNSTNVFGQLPTTTSLYEDQYDVVAGEWPDEYDELVLVLNSDGSISDLMEYYLGLEDYSELEEMIDSLMNADGETSDEEDDEPAATYSYDELLGITFKLVAASDFYSYDEEYNVWTDMTDDSDYMADLVANGEELTIVGIVKAKEDATASVLSSGVYYTEDLTYHVSEIAEASEIVQQQIAEPDVNVFTGNSFDDDSGTDFDMSSMLTIDGDAISAAFSIDSSALELDLSSIDLSSIDTSSISMTEMDLSDLEFDIDTSDITVDLSSVDLSSLVPELTDEDLAEILSSVDLQFTETGSEELSAALTQIMSEYLTNMDSYESLEAYMNSDEVQAQLAAAVMGAVDTDALTSSLEAAIGAYLADYDMEGVTEEIMSQVMASYQEQLAAAISESVSSAVSAYMQTAMTSMMTQLTSAIQSELESSLTSAMSDMMSGMADAMSVDEDALAEAFQFNMDEDELAALMAALYSTSSTSYEDNLASLGYADFATPSQIDIYSKDFEAKESVTDILNDYNDQVEEAGEEEKAVVWTDYVGVMMSSVTNILDMITAVLIAFVSISLVVSSIMIGVITNISVLERKKEIGILRSIGASKGNISSIFIAETVIEGFTSGLMGVLITMLACIPANMIIENMFGVVNLAELPANSAVALVALSVALNVIAGFFPSRKAAKSDPVEALRSE